MEIRITPTPEKPVVSLEIFSGEFSIESGSIRFATEMRNLDGLIIDKKYVEFFLPTLTIDAIETNTQSYIKALALQQLGLSENLEEPTEVIAATLINWQGFISAFSNTSFYEKVEAAIRNDLKVNASFSLLFATFAIAAFNKSNPNLDNFTSALVNIVSDMGELLDATDLATVNQILVDNHFSIAL